MIFISRMFALVVLLSLPGLVSAQGTWTAKTPPPQGQTNQALTKAEKVHVLGVYDVRPLSFETNVGQIDPRVRFLSRGNGYTLFFTLTGAVLSLSRPIERSHIGQKRDLRTAQSSVLRIELLRANRKSQISGIDELPGKSNYFVGNDPKKWHRNVPTFSKVKYRNVYPGIDLTYYGNQRQLEHDFLVWPGADPDSIVLEFQGTDKLEVDAQGGLVLHTSLGAIRQSRPFVYQNIGGRQRQIACAYVLKSERQVGFQLEAYDASRPIVIDPVLSYSTYLGGSGYDNGIGIAVDSAGSAYVTGQTDSSNFPTANAAQSAIGGGFDAFVTKLNPTGSGLVYSTYVGGSGQDGPGDITVDASGNAYITGGTTSTNFPITAAFQSTYGGGGADAFVTKLGPTGSNLVYSTYLGGGDYDATRTIAVDAAGNAYVSGDTNSIDFPTIPTAFQTTYAGGQDVVVTKLSATGSGLLYSTYLGDSDIESAYSIAVDASMNAYVTGYTCSTNFPTTAGAFQTIPQGGCDAFVTKLNPAGTAPLVYSTYFGGNDFDIGSGIAVDTTGYTYLAGSTNSTIFPTTTGAFQTTYGGGGDAFVAKLNPSGAGPLVYSTYLGGTSPETDFALAVDSAGNAYLTGATESANFPTVNALQAAIGGVRDAFVTKVNPSGSALLYSTYLGGNGDDGGQSIALDTLPNPSAYVSGFTSSSNFPTANPLQPASGGGSYDAFITKIGSPASKDFFLHGSGGLANPPTLYLDNTAPTSSNEAYKDSNSVNFSGGNPWKEIGTWSASPSLTNGPMTSLSDLHAWLGLKNSDDQGTRFDMRAEVLKNGSTVASGETFCVQGITRNPSLAKEATTAFGAFLPVVFNGTTDVLSLRVLTRIGTNGAGASCGGHSNAVGLRLYFDATSRPARFDATF
jgi:hypothetical protein